MKEKITTKIVADKLREQLGVKFLCTENDKENAFHHTTVTKSTGISIMRSDLINKIMVWVHNDTKKSDCNYWINNEATKEEFEQFISRISDDYFLDKILN